MGRRYEPSHLADAGDADAGCADAGDAAPGNADPAGRSTGSEPSLAEGPDAVPGEVLARLEDRLDEALRLARRRDELIDKLHSENQRLRQGELHTAMLPLLRDLMRLHDDLERIVEVDPAAHDTVLIRDALADALARNGITRFVPGESEPFDSAQHAAVGSEPVDDPQRDRTICAVRRAGFRRDDGSIVRVADVAVRRYRSAAPSDSVAAGATAGDPEPRTDASAAGAIDSNIDNERN